MKKTVFFIVGLIASVCLFGQTSTIFDNQAPIEPSVNPNKNAPIVTPQNFESWMHIHYGFIANNRYYIVSYTTPAVHDGLGRIPELTRTLKLYMWVNNNWVTASDDIISLDYRKSMGGTMVLHDKIRKRDLSEFSYVKTFNDTIVMLMTYQHQIVYYKELKDKKTDIYLYNTINYFIPKGDGTYTIHTFKPHEFKTAKPAWIVDGDSDIIKSKNNFIIKFSNGKNYNFTVQ